MLAGRIERPGVAQPELGVERRADRDEVGELVAADDAAEAVGRLDVEVDRQQRRRAQLGKLGRRHVRRDVDRGRPEPGQHDQRRRIGRRHRDGDLPAAVRRQLAGRLHVPQERQQAHVGDEKAPDPGLCGARDVLDRVRQSPDAAQLTGMAGAVRRARMRPDTVALPGTDEQRHLDTRLGGDGRRLAQLGLGEQHRAAALGDAVDDDPMPAGGVEHRLEHAEVLHAWDLDSEVGAVGKAPGARHRTCLARGETEPPERAVALQRHPAVLAFRVIVGILFGCVER